jgi:hypothetical protein
LSSSKIANSPKISSTEAGIRKKPVYSKIVNTREDTSLVPDPPQELKSKIFLQSNNNKTSSKHNLKNSAGVSTSKNLQLMADV